MNLKLRHLHYFITVVDAGSFSRASSTIHIAQPALSRQILELEEMLGVELLHRTARGIRPTSAGEALYREAISLVRQVERIPDIVRSASGGIEGTVSIGMSSTLASYLAGQLMEACKAQFPKIRLRLITADSLVLRSRLDANEIDLAVIFEDQLAPGYARSLLFRQRLYLIHREHPTDGTTSISLKRLTGLPLILPASSNVTRLLIDRVFCDIGASPNLVGEADALSSMLSAVQSGMGFTILPKGDLSDVPGYGSFAALPIEPALFLTASVIASNETPLCHAAMMVRVTLNQLVFDIMQKTPPPGAEWAGSDPKSIKLIEPKIQ